MGIRKDQATLTAGEKRRFVNAVLRLKQVGQYDTLVKIHQDILTRDFSESGPTAHGSASFLPWHRKYLIEFERALQAIDPSVNLPYWNWTVDRTPRSSIWSNDLLGGNGVGTTAEVTTGPFAYRNGKWKINVREDDRPYLVREFSNDPLPTRANLAAALGTPDYDRAPWNRATEGGFRDSIELIHNTPHVWIGGQMGTSVSPNDPAFWLHHCFIDKCWSDWQKRHPAAGYLPTAGTEKIVDLNEPMNPWPTVTPADMLNHAPLYTYA